jgi:myo-inositol-1(or 4)-monophosphatase
MVKLVALKEILPRFRHSLPQEKADGSIITAADLQCQSWLSQALQERWPGLPLLGEEMSDKRQAELLTQSYSGLWVLDPLDGTANFAAGFPVFSVSLALVVSGSVVQGVVYDPVRDECFYAEAGKGAWLNGETLKLAGAQVDLEASIALVDFKRLSPRLAAALATDPPFRSQRSLGSVAIDWCWLAAGRAQIYHHGGQSLWDYAAGRLIFLEAGGHCLIPEARLSLQKQEAVAALSSERLKEWHDWLRANGL